MNAPDTRIAYIVKRYPRFSETFIVNEILAHEAVGVVMDIVAIRPCSDAHFQDRISRVKAPVSVLPSGSVRGDQFWNQIQRVAKWYPKVWTELRHLADEDALNIYQALLLAERIHARNITHLHAHFASDSTTVARLASRFTGVPYSFTAHAKDIYHESVLPEDFRRKLRDASGVVTVSDFNLHHLRQEFGGDASRVTRIYNGLDLSQFPFQPPSPTQRRTLLAVGRMVEKKGFQILIAACAELARRNVPFDCEFIGEGDEESSLMAEVQRLGLSDHVHFCGAQPQSEVIRAMQRATVIAAPCIVGKDGNRDGMPTVLLEAMALGTPCVATDVTGIPEAILDNEHGLIVPQGDVPALADALERLLDDLPLRIRLAQAARARVEERFNVVTSTWRLRQLFASESRPTQEEPSSVKSKIPSVSLVEAVG